MKALRDNQKGAAHLVAICSVVLLAAVAFTGYRVMHKNDKQEAAKSSSSTSLTEKVPSKIKTKSDLQQASKALDQTADPLDPSQLDSDLNDLL